MTGPRAKAFQALGHVAIRTKLPRTLRLINMRSVSDILSYMHECLKGYITMSADRTVMDPRRYWCSCSGFQGLENRSVWRLSASVTNKGGISPYLQQSYMSLEHLFPAINTHGSIHNTGSLSSVVLEGKWNRPVVQKTHNIGRTWQYCEGYSDHDGEVTAWPYGKCAYDRTEPRTPIPSGKLDLADPLHNADTFYKLNYRHYPNLCNIKFWIYVFQIFSPESW